MGILPARGGITSTASGILGRVNSRHRVPMNEIPSPGQAQRVVLIDDHVSVRQTLAFVLKQEPGYEIVAEASGGIEGLTVCRRSQPDIIILDLALPELNGLSLLRLLRLECGTARCLVFTGTCDEELLRCAIALEPHGFISKTDPLPELRHALRILSAGGRFVSKSCERLTRAAREDFPQRLNVYETAVLQMVAESRQTKEIADVLRISVKAVDHHRQRVMSKLDLHDIAAITRFALKNRMIFP
jgi:DNA-binding NarL/FixJ family response regulator